MWDRYTAAPERSGSRLSPSRVPPPDRSCSLQIAQQLGERRQVLIALQDDATDRGARHSGLHDVPDLRRYGLRMAVDQRPIVAVAAREVKLHDPVPRPSIEDVIQV